MQYLPVCTHKLHFQTHSTNEMNKNECTLSKRKLIEQQYNSNNNVLSFISGKNASFKHSLQNYRLIDLPWHITLHSQSDHVICFSLVF
jgi:hypothetical protein